MLRSLRLPLLAFALLGSAALAVEDEPQPPVVPDMPALQLPDPALQKEYEDAVEKLSKGSYKEARESFRRLKSKVEKEPREAMERGLLEAEGGLELDKATEELRTGKVRKAMVRVLKLGDRFAGTKTGAELAQVLAEAEAMLFLTVADFEEAATKPASPPGEPAPQPDPPEGGEGEGGTGRGESGYGLNSRVIQGTPEEGTVRTGRGALSWRTGRDLSALTFTALKDKVGEYRYLDLSIRCESDEARPNLVLLLDTLEGDLRGGMGGGPRGGGRAGAAWVYQREGFHTTITPQAKWQDLRLDLSKFTRKGEVTLDMVLSLRIVHMPGVSGIITIDDIRLEKE
ncbi:MAG: hypothetical protein AB7O52_14265 [Planctomycetota bacterium]